MSQPRLFDPPGSYYVSYRGNRYLVIKEGSDGWHHAIEDGRDYVTYVHDDYMIREDGLPKVGDSLPLYTVYAAQPEHGTHHLSLDDILTLCGEPIPHYNMGNTKWPYGSFITHRYMDTFYHTLCKRCGEVLGNA